ncbi:restriction endonuclease [Sporosarcina sp. P13]|uniref:restriction endonuclease n=1 Tax=Sporosarcina sp. P13 TaxID=2048263 RepID=UPI000C16A532|nr:restriction endonuclease [Sporosarcina sp. P13]PIC62757.1 restriction endonuclease [Sporosarcina sp. P13]
MNRGYAGFYKGFYLRSSYEYAYAVYLDQFNIPWSFEDQNFEVHGKVYKPDFFFYDKQGSLEKIVEIKSRNKKEIELAREKLDYIKAQYQIKTELISYEELMKIYETMPMTLNSVIKHWITSDNTTIHKAVSGRLNAHYGLRHSEDSKKKIGEHTKKLWDGDSLSKKKMIDGLRKSGLSQKGKIKTEREIRYCALCFDEFTVMVTSTQKYCGQQCSGQLAIRIATDSYVKSRNSIHRNIKEYIIQWTSENKELVLSTPFNKINSTITPLTNEIFSRYGVKDMRVISKAVFGEDKGRKELLRFMKKLCSENVC